jgi:hypothetical protein
VDNHTKKSLKDLQRGDTHPPEKKIGQQLYKAFLVLLELWSQDPVGVLFCILEFCLSESYAMGLIILVTREVPLFRLSGSNERGNLLPRDT